MESPWQDATLADLYPYWIVGEVPPEAVPDIACNDLVLGTTAPEIVALAALMSPATPDVAPLLPPAFARLCLPPLTKREALLQVALDRMRKIAKRVVLAQLTPDEAATGIYFSVQQAQLIPGRDDATEQEQVVSGYGLTFLQMADFLDHYREHPVQRQRGEAAIIEAARALLSGEPLLNTYLNSLCR